MQGLDISVKTVDKDTGLITALNLEKKQIEDANVGCAGRRDITGGLVKVQEQVNRNKEF